MFREDPLWARRAEQVSALTRDITEFLSEIGLAPATTATGLTIAYHSACSMQHGQKITAQPKALLTAAGFTVRDVPEGHLCCGSAGTYNLLQPETGRRAARAQAPQHRGDAARRRRHRQYRLHRPARARGSGAGPAHRRVARLGHRRASPGQVESHGLTNSYRSLTK